MVSTYLKFFVLFLQNVVPFFEGKVFARHIVHLRLKIFASSDILVFKFLVIGLHDVKHLLKIHSFFFLLFDGVKQDMVGLGQSFDLVLVVPLFLVRLLLLCLYEGNKYLVRYYNVWYDGVRNSCRDQT